MDSRDRPYKTRQINGTIRDQDFDLYAKSGQQRVPRILHDGTGQAWVSSHQFLTGDYALSSHYDFGRIPVFDDFRAGWLSVRPQDRRLDSGGQEEIPSYKALTRALQRPEGAALHRFGNFLITHPNTAYHLGVLSAHNYCGTQY